jgi:hypothetical protein
VNIHSIVLKDKEQPLYYYKQEADIKNPLGKVSAILSAYIVVNSHDNISNIVCRLYKTKEGYWYDPLEMDDQVDSKTKLEIKSAIDAIENQTGTVTGKAFR